MGFRLARGAARRGDEFTATSIGWVGIFPCVGGRDPEAASELERALAGAYRRPAAELPIKALHRGEPGLADKIWYQGPGFWLERKPAGDIILPAATSLRAP